MMNAKKQFFKVMINLTVLLILVSTFSINALASLGTLSHWDITVDNPNNRIARWGSRTTSIPSSIFISKLNNNGSFFFVTGFDTAVAEWGGALGRTISVAGGSSSSIRFRGGTRAELEALGIFGTIPVSDAGRAFLTTNAEGTWHHTSGNKNGRLLTLVQGYIVDRGYTQNQQRMICTHEFGHAMGWYGHASSTTTAVMRNSVSSAFTLTNIDKRNITQLYG